MSPLPRTGRGPEPDPVTLKTPVTTVVVDPTEPAAARPDESAAPSRQNEHQVANAESRDTEPTPEASESPEADAPRSSRVIELLDATVAAARDVEMSSSELMGLLFFYAHNVAQDTRETVIQHQQGD